jgi:ribosomal protein S18 acetylase RimI-like enzyme
MRRTGWRPFESGDLGACRRIFDSNVPEFFRDAERVDFEAFLRVLPGPYIVLEHGAEIVACGGYALREKGTITDLCWGMVRRDLHGTGLGRALTERRLALALDDPRVREVLLNTSQHTVGFYERLGFEVLRVEHDGYAKGLDRCEMRLLTGDTTGEGTDRQR